MNFIFMIFLFLFSLSELKQAYFKLYKKLILGALDEFQKWNNAALIVQISVFKSRKSFLSTNANVKKNVIVRFFNSPNTESRFPTYVDANRFIQVQGIVNSLTKKGYIELAREFICKKCDSVVLLTGNYNNYFILTTPSICSRENCNGVMCVKPNVSFKKYAYSYQEVYLEEMNAQNSRKPRYLTVSVENDLVDYCSLGDDVVIVGTIEIRQKTTPLGKTVLNNFVLRANSIIKNENKVESLSEEQHYLINEEWNQIKISKNGEFGARDFLIKSMLPALYCMYLPKLAIALALCSCVDYDKNNKNRSQIHVLFVGEPGLAKSKLLQRAVELSSKGFFAGGYRVSKAGLTAGVTKVEGDDVYEAGILPLCDGGVCAIDEFNLMAEDDKSAIHEAMEQQTISITKAGVVATLRSRCAVIGALNPKNMKRLTTDSDSCIKFGLQPALLSRFDVIFVLRDECNRVWDEKVTDHVMKTETGILNQSDCWSTEHLKMHFLAARDTKSTLSSHALEILVAYFRKLSENTRSNSTRVTARCLDSLTRLTLAYSRLMLRQVATALDAVVVIILIMENTFDMGSVILPQNIIKKELPLGPTKSEVVTLLRGIGLPRMIDVVLSELQIADSNETKEPHKTISFETHIEQSQLSSPFGKKVESSVFINNSIAIEEKVSKEQPILNSIFEPKNYSLSINKSTELKQPNDDANQNDNNLFKEILDDFLEE